MYSKLLVPLDGSQSSEAILPYARFVSKALSLPVELLQVTGLGAVSALPYPRFGRFFAAGEADMKKRSKDYLESVGQSFSKSSIINYSVESGDPTEIILAKAAAQSGTLIAMSTRARSDFQRWVLGSVADEILHTAANPLLLVKATAESTSSQEATIEAILVPLDGSSLAETALPHVVALAQETKLGVVLLLVYTNAQKDYIAAAYMPGPQQAALSSKQGAKCYLERKAQELRSEGLEKVSWLMLEGDAPREIVKIARQMTNNLVAMSTHGRAGITRWVLGSVTDHTVRHCGDPVMVIRAPAVHGNGKAREIRQPTAIH